MDDFSLPDDFAGMFPPHRNSRTMSLDKLIDAILKLEKDGIISFEEFKKLGYQKIQKEYFGMISETQMFKAITKIGDLKEGKTGQSSITKITEIRDKDGKLTIKKQTSFF